MISPETIGERLIELWRDIPTLVAVCGADADNIFLYRDSIPAGSNLFDAILAQPEGSLMLSWDGTGPGRQGNSVVWASTFTAHLRPAPESAAEPAGYFEMWRLLVNGVPTETGKKWHVDDLVAGVYVSGVPGIARRQFVVGSDAGQARIVGYWAAAITVNQLGDDDS